MNARWSRRQTVAAVALVSSCSLGGCVQYMESTLPAPAVCPAGAPQRAPAASPPAPAFDGERSTPPPPAQPNRDASPNRGGRP